MEAETCKWSTWCSLLVIVVDTLHWLLLAGRDVAIMVNVHKALILQLVDDVTGVLDPLRHLIILS